MYSTKKQTVRTARTVKTVRTVRTAGTARIARTLPDLSRFERSELLLRMEQRPVLGTISPRRSYQPPMCLFWT